MTLRAVTKAGTSVRLAAHHGDNAERLIEQLVEQGLTGSANPFPDVSLDTEDGGAILFSEVERIEKDERTT
jgi:hypothetical protein